MPKWRVNDYYSGHEFGWTSLARRVSKVRSVSCAINTLSQFSELIFHFFSACFVWISTHFQWKKVRKFVFYFEAQNSHNILLPKSQHTYLRRHVSYLLNASRYVFFLILVPHFFFVVDVSDLGFFLSLFRRRTPSQTVATISPCHSIGTHAPCILGQFPYVYSTYELFKLNRFSLQMWSQFRRAHVPNIQLVAFWRYCLCAWQYRCVASIPFSCHLHVIEIEETDTTMPMPLHKYWFKFEKRWRISVCRLTGVCANRDSFLSKTDNSQSDKKVGTCRKN